jgi:hypothetical protein
MQFPCSIQSAYPGRFYPQVFGAIALRLIQELNNLMVHQNTAC